MPTGMCSPPRSPPYMAATAASSARAPQPYTHTVLVAREATVLFLAQSTLNRPDIKATVVANDRKAQRDDTLPTDDLYELHPGFYEALAPASTGVREPAVVTWVVEPDLDGHTPYAEGGEPRQAALDARAGVLLAKKGPTEQFPALFDAALDATDVGKSAYAAAYRGHPSPLEAARLLPSPRRGRSLRYRRDSAVVTNSCVFRCRDRH